MSEELKEEVGEVVDFCKAVGLELHPEVVWRGLSARVRTGFEELARVLEDMGHEHGDCYSEHFFKKWDKLLSHRRILHSVPFVDFVFVAGSVAIGSVHEHSDFDLVIGAKSGRIFTARFFAALFTEMFGRRKRKEHEGAEAGNKICLNHFVAPGGYRLDPPYNVYWTQLYRRLVPLVGSETRVKKFFASNGWAKVDWEKVEKKHWRRTRRRNLVGRFLEKILSGKFGDWVEEKLKDYQVKRIEKGVEDGELGHKPSLKYSDNEIRFHVDTLRIEKVVEMVDNYK